MGNIINFPHYSADEFEAIPLTTMYMYQSATSSNKDFQNDFGFLKKVFK